MTTSTFPSISSIQDSKFYSVELEDPSLKTKMEGGYVISRAKHTRRPRRTFTTGFSFIKDSERKILEDFYDSVRGSSLTFYWNDPIYNERFTVRFAEKYSFKYIGIRNVHRWDVTFSLEEA